MDGEKQAEKYKKNETKNATMKKMKKFKDKTKNLESIREKCERMKNWKHS